MSNILGIIDYIDRKLRHGERSDKKAIFVPCICKFCGKATIRDLECPPHLQLADPGYICYIDEDGQLQARRDP
jgi:hypothetical protein